MRRSPQPGTAWPASSVCPGTAWRRRTAAGSTSVRRWWTGRWSSSVTGMVTGSIVSSYSCVRSGERSSCSVFLSEGGAECVTSHYSQILSCVNNSVPEIFRTSPKVRQTSRIHFYVFQQENCRSGGIQKYERSLLWCNDVGKGTP